MKKTIPFLLTAVIGFGPGWLMLSPALDLALFQMKKMDHTRAVHNGSWSTALEVGSSEATALFRAITAKIGLGANSCDEATYWLAIRDKNGERITGGQTYEVRFSQTPSIDRTAGFWSICVYNSNDYFVPNPMKRYNLGDRSPLARNADGSFTIYISPCQPKEINNWLPSPETGEPIGLTIRMYAPLPEVLKEPGKSPMPEIIRVPHLPPQGPSAKTTL
jgi:hypothetical protein